MDIFEKVNTYDEYDMHFYWTPPVNPLLRAICRGRYEIVRILLKNGANKEIIWKGMTPIHVALDEYRLASYFLRR